MLRCNSFFAKLPQYGCTNAKCSCCNSLWIWIILRLCYSRDIEPIIKTHKFQGRKSIKPSEDTKTASTHLITSSYRRDGFVHVHLSHAYRTVHVVTIYIRASVVYCMLCFGDWSRKFNLKTLAVKRFLSNGWWTFCVHIKLPSSFKMVQFDTGKKSMYYTDL